MTQSDLNDFLMLADVALAVALVLALWRNAFPPKRPLDIDNDEPPTGIGA